jgi:hypothetical protein
MAQSKRLSLKPLRLDDANALRSITDDPAITGAISFLSSPVVAIHDWRC